MLEAIKQFGRIAIDVLLFADDYLLIPLLFITFILWSYEYKKNK